jgi:hypothetical protein
VNAEVMAMKAAYQDGRRVLTLVQSARTNDLGEYRLYWLVPGQYYVSSMPWDGRPISGGVVMNANGAAAGVNVARMTVLAGDVARAPLGFQPGAPPSDTEAWLPIYFPSASTEDAASAIDLMPGASARGIDVVIAPVRPRRIQGTVIDLMGQPVPKAQIFRSATSSPSTFVPNAANPVTGAFDLHGVVPGSHTLLAVAGERAGKVVVQVGDRDLDDVRIVVRSGQAIAGRIMIDGQQNAAIDSSILRVSLRPEPAVPGLPIPASVVSSSGSFSLDQVMPGTYTVTVQPLQSAPPVATGQRGNAMPLAPPPAQRGGPLAPLPPALQGAYVKAVRLGSVDVLAEGLTVEDEIREPLEILIGANPGLIEGDVGRTPNVTVVLVPKTRTQRDLYKSVMTDTEGNFTFRGVPPGDYTLFGWDDVETGAWMNADFLQQYESRGRSIHIDEGSRQTVPQLQVLD